MTELIYHISSKVSWDSQKESKYYVHESLESEGFVHCSYKHQIEGVLSRYFKGEKNLLILTIDAGLVSADIKAEVSTGEVLYPHIYGAIEKSAIIDISDI